MKIINNYRVKRNLSNGLWLKSGVMFPFDYKYYQIGFFGFIILINTNQPMTPFKQNTIFSIGLILGILGVIVICKTFVV